ncbi:MAG: ATP synthase subunit I [Clostridia bacterium]|nr:ATP synthase subunit I [Clostridia bacterium]
MESRKIVYRETGIVALGQVIGLALMYVVFALLNRFDQSVLLGGLLGTVLSIANFFFMAVSATLASDKAINQDVKGGKSLMKGSYFLRLALIFLILFAGIKSGLCHVLSSVLPLVFVRPIITIAEFFRKGDVKQA